MTVNRYPPSTVGSAESARGLRSWCVRACLAAGIGLAVGFQGIAFGAAPGRKPKEPPAREELEGNELITGDGVRLSATFFPGTKGKETVPVILLHMWKGSRKDYLGLAPLLQKQGHAVLVPDLRGHGLSTGLVGSRSTRKLDAAKMSSDHFYQMPYSDMETLRRFLVRKNDEGELNLSNLCIVGAEMGAAVAVYYAAYDWSTPRREAQGVGITGDVKALVLISPKWAFQGLPLSKKLQHPGVRSQIPMLIVVGKDDPRSLSDAKRIYNVLKRFHPDEEGLEKDLFLGEIPTKLQGTKMLGVRGLNLDRPIGAFIERSVAKKNYPWRQRGRKG